MLSKYRPVIDGLPAVVRAYLADAFQIPAGSIPGPTFFYPELQRRGLCQADLVLKLLEARNHRHFDALVVIEQLSGKPLAVIPPRPVVPLPTPTEQAKSKGPDDRRIITVVRNPRLPTTPSFERFKQFRSGRTIKECLARGVTRKDFREALAASPPWITLEVLP